MKNIFDISFVVVTRNDNHGLNLNKRTNRFIDSCNFMSERHGVNVELLIVEWNPPSDADPLEKLIGPMLTKNKFLKVKIVTVPNSMHKKFENSNNLHLYQMIGKNVGIRRASSEFILATNIDIIFTDEIFIKFKRGLRKNTLYRCHRLDVPENFAFEEGAELLLKKCIKSFHTVNSRFGTILINKFFNNVIIHSLPLSLRLNGYNFACFILRIYRELCAIFKNLFANLIGIFKIRNKNLKIFSITSLKDFVLSPLKNFSITSLKDFVLIIIKNYKIHFLNCYLFSNACGDFTLMDKKSWVKVGGYLELPIYSLHIDSFLLYQAFYKKIKVNTIANNVIFHIDHSKGSGFSIAGEELLLSNLRKKSIPFMSYDDYKLTVTKIKECKLPYNTEWGLKNIQFKETTLA